MHPDLLSHIVPRLHMRDLIPLAQINSVVYTRFADRLNLQPILDQSIKTLNEFCKILYNFDNGYIYLTRNEEFYEYKEKPYDLDDEQLNDILGANGWTNEDKNILLKKSVVNKMLATIIPVAQLSISKFLDKKLGKNVMLHDRTLKFFGMHSRIHIKDILDNLKQIQPYDENDRNYYNVATFKASGYQDHKLHLQVEIDYV